MSGVRRCLWCNGPLIFARGRGWVHSKGGGLYWQRCSHCGWEGSSSILIFECPECRSPDLHDDHMATPVASQREAG